MTPLKIEILLHYCARADDYRAGEFSAPAVRQAIDDLKGDLGLLEAWPDSERPRGNRQCYRLSARGLVFVEAVVAMPLPVQAWVMP